jgi:hypothetical protein
VLEEFTAGAPGSAKAMSLSYIPLASILELGRLARRCDWPRMLDSLMLADIGVMARGGGITGLMAYTLCNV